MQLVIHNGVVGLPEIPGTGEGENRELKTMLADSLLKFRVLEEVTAKSGGPSALVMAVVSRGLCSERLPWLPRSNGIYRPKEPGDWLRKLHDHVEKLSQSIRGLAPAS
jgi:hypothetical protein